MSFEKKLQSLRKRAGLSQEELANELGVSRQAVSKWESGISYPEMDKLILMTKLFKCSLDDLVNDEKKNIDANNKINKTQAYIDSLLDFINKSISMFTSMKASAILKWFIEMGVLILVLLVVSMCFCGISDALFVFMFRGILNPLYWFFMYVVITIVVALDFIIVFQFYKIRYLDYYDKLVLQYEEKENSSTASNTISNASEEKVEKEKADSKKRERIIIRDPEHKPLAFLSSISKIILLMYKCVLRFITVPFLFLFVFLVFGIVISIYLVTYNDIFIGVSIVFAAAILVNLLFIRTLSDDLFKSPYPVKLMSILFIVSLFIGGIGLGTFVISLKDIEFKEADTLVRVNEEFEYSDKLYLNFLGSTYGRMTFETDDTINNVVVNSSYDSREFKYEFSNPAGDKNYLLLTRMFVEDFSTKQVLDEFLHNLKNDLVLSYGSYGEPPFIRIRANEKNIKKLISNISERNSIYVKEKSVHATTYYTVYSVEIDNDDAKVCYVDDYYKKCLKIKDATNDRGFTYNFKDGDLIYDRLKYVCYTEDDGYTCDYR